MYKKISYILILLVIAILGMQSVSAYPTYLSNFNTQYGTSGTVLDTCGLCHIDPNGGGARNPYGVDFANNGHSFTAIEQMDSDGDGFKNIDEINALTFPGDSASHPPTPTPTATIIVTPTPVLTPTPTIIPTVTVTPILTPTPTATATPIPDMYVSISPESTTVHPGDSFSIDIYVDPKEKGVSSGQVDLSFNASLLQVTGLEKGDILGSDALNTGSGYDNTDGTVTAVLAHIGTTTPPTSPGTWAKVTFAVKSDIPNSKTRIRIENAGFVDENFNDIPYIEITNGVVKISSLVGDINGDGKVDFIDLGILAASYGLSEGDTGYNPDADLNSDGRVDFIDLGMLAANYGKSI